MILSALLKIKKKNDKTEKTRRGPDWGFYEANKEQTDGGVLFVVLMYSTTFEVETAGIVFATGVPRPRAGQNPTRGQKKK